MAVDHPVVPPPPPKKPKPFTVTQPAAPAPTAKEIIEQASPLRAEEAMKAMAEVSRQRARMAVRLADITLFPGTMEDEAKAGWKTKARPTDHPLVQVLFKLRDKFNAVDRRILSAEAAGSSVDTLVKLETLSVNTLLRIGEVAKDVTQEAHKASVELQSMLASQAALDQRRREHEEKLEFAREKLRAERRSTDYTDLDLLKMAEADLTGLPDANMPIHPSGHE